MRWQGRRSTCRLPPGGRVQGRVLATFVRGHQVFAASSYGGRLPTEPCGRLLLGKRSY